MLVLTLARPHLTGRRHQRSPLGSRRRLVHQLLQRPDEPEPPNEGRRCGPLMALVHDHDLADRGPLPFEPNQHLHVPMVNAVEAYLNQPSGGFFLELREIA